MSKTYSVRLSTTDARLTPTHVSVWETMGEYIMMDCEYAMRLCAHIIAMKTKQPSHSCIKDFCLNFGIHLFSLHKQNGGLSIICNITKYIGYCHSQQTMTHPHETVAGTTAVLCCSTAGGHGVQFLLYPCSNVLCMYECCTVGVCVCHVYWSQSPVRACLCVITCDYAMCTVHVFSVDE